MPFDNIVCDLSNALSILGQIKLNLTINKTNITRSFAVISNSHLLPADIIIGYDILNDLEAVIDCKQNSLILNNERVPLIEKPTFSACCIKFVSIDSRTSHVIPMKTSAPDGSYYLTPSGSNPIAEGLIQVVDNKFNALLFNPSDSDVFINKNNNIGLLEPINLQQIVSVQNNGNFSDVRKINANDISKSPENCDSNQQLLDLLNEFRNIVALPGEDLGQTHVLEAEINTGDNNPIFTRQYPLPHKTHEIIDELSKDMLKKGIIRESSSPWNSPVLLIKKKDNQGHRLVLDFRKLNLITETERFPVPSVFQILQNLKDARYFSVIDLDQAFWQTNISQKDMPKTAFTTKTARFEFQRMAFGLKNAPATFSKLMQMVLSGLLDREMLIYIDDIVIFSKTKEEHFVRLRKLFGRLSKANLKIKLAKCSFLKSEVKFLGHKVSADGISIHPDHFEPLSKLKVPTNQKEVKQFLGCTSYFRSYIPNFAEIAAPIISLLRKKSKFIWDSEHQSAFDNLKDKILSAKPLNFPNFDDEFYIQSDASTTSIGAVLLQKHCDNLVPISCVSRILSDSEKKYCTTKLEALAIIFALKKFRPLIEGYKIVIYSDHKPLSFLFKKDIPQGQLGRWCLFTQDFDLSIRYLPGRFNFLADTLSRLNHESEDSMNIDDHFESKLDFVGAVSLHNDSWKTAQLSDVRLAKIIKILNGDKSSKRDSVKTANYVLLDGLLYFRRFLKRSGIEEMTLLRAVPKSMEEKVIIDIHEANGHLAAERTLERLQRSFYIESGALSKVTKTLYKCHLCCVYKAKRGKPAMYSKHPLPDTPFQNLATDFLGPFSATEQGNKYILVICDYLTRFVLLYAVPDRRAENVAFCLNDCFKKYAVPLSLKSDNAKEFTADLIKVLCTNHGIKKIEVAPYSPWSNGLAERANANILPMLKIFCSEQETSNWDIFLNDVASAINGSLNSSIGDTPFFALYHFDKNDLFSNMKDIDCSPFYNYDDYFKSVEFRSKLVFNFVKDHLSSEMDSYLKIANRKSSNANIEVNDRIFIKYVPRPRESSKLAQKWYGPAFVLEKISPNKYLVLIKATGKKQIVHYNNLIVRNDFWIKQ